MKIDELPVEMLIRIFSFLPSYNEVSLVNKQFYTIACDVNSAICLPINERTLHHLRMDPKCMQNSRKKVSKFVLMPMNPLLLRHVIPTVTTFAATITILRWDHMTIDLCNFSKILSLTPNIVHLGVWYGAESGKECPAHTTRCNNDLNLQKLRSLKIFRSEEFVRVFERLPVGILTELHVCAFSWHALKSVLNRQFNIKKLKLAFCSSGHVDTNIFDKMNLESLELSNMGRARASPILSKQTQLKSLVLSGATETREQDLNAIGNRLEIEKLDISVCYIQLASFVKLRKLKKLKELKLQFRDDGRENMEMIQALAGWNNTSLVKLNLNLYSFITAEVAEALAKSAPQLKHLILRSGTLDWNSMVRQARHAIMTCFNFVNVLAIEAWGKPTPDSNYLNQNLRELNVSVEVSFYELRLTEFKVSYPNLTKLTIHVVSIEEPFSGTLNIRPILDWLTKLEYLTVYSSNLIVHDVEYLVGNKGSLKFVSLEHLDATTITDDLVKRFRADFDFLSFDKRHRCLKMAVDRHTYYHRESNF